MRKDSLSNYWVVIHCHDPRFAKLREACHQATGEEGHDSVRITSPVKPAELEKHLGGADIVVLLCSRATRDVVQEAEAAAKGGSAVLLYVIGRELSGNSWEAVRASIEKNMPGSKASCTEYVATDVFLRTYLSQLNRAVRILDAGQTDEAINPYVARFVRRLKHWVVESRLEQNARYKRAVADFFLDVYFPLLVNAGIQKWFFESGSSIALLGERFLPRLNDEWVQRKISTLTIETNNLLCLIEFVEARGVGLHLFPDGPPETKYGATFGRLSTVPPSRGALNSRAREAVDEVKQNFARYKDAGIIFGATSGIDLRLAGPAPGPHAGSYPNMLLKRAILESGAPVVLFLDQDKLPYDFVPNRCFSVCDKKEFPWRKVCKEIPLALACAFESRDRALGVLPRLKELGFTHVESSRETETPWSVVVSNHKFAALAKTWQSVM